MSSPSRGFPRNPQSQRGAYPPAGCQTRVCFQMPVCTIGGPRSPTLAVKLTTALGILPSSFLQMGKLRLKEAGLRSHSSQRCCTVQQTPAHPRPTPFSLDQHFLGRVLWNFRLLECSRGGPSGKERSLTDVFNCVEPAVSHTALTQNSFPAQGLPEAGVLGNHRQTPC